MHTLFVSEPNTKWPVYAGHFVFLIHFIFAFVFVFERTMYSDSAYFIFNIINSENFFVGAERYGSILPQLLPLLAVKLGCSLKFIIYIFSLSYVIFYYSIYNLVVYGFKNTTAGLAIALSLFMCSEHNHFMVIFEMQQAIIFCILFYVIMNYYYTGKAMNEIIFMGLSMVVILLCFFSHPAVIFSLLFVIAFVAVDKKKYLDGKLYFFIFLLVSIAYAKTLFIEHNSYEGNFVQQVKGFKDTIRHFLHLNSTKFFLSRFLSIYLLTFIMGVLVLYWYLRRKQYLKFLLLTGTVVFFLIIVNLIFHEGDSDMMMERIYIQLSVFVLIPFMKDFFSQHGNLLSVKILLTLIVIVSAIRVINKGLFYHKRVEYVSSIIAHEKNNKQAKFIINKKRLNKELIMVPWAFAIETLLYSSLDGTNHSKTFYVAEDIETFEYNYNDKELFLAVPFWRDRKSESLNEKYFRLPSEKYTLIR